MVAVETNLESGFPFLLCVNVGVLSRSEAMHNGIESVALFLRCSVAVSMADDGT